MNPVVVAVLATMAIFLFAITLAFVAFLAHRIVKAGVKIGEDLRLCAKAMMDTRDDGTSALLELNANVNNLAAAVFKFQELVTGISDLIGKVPEDLKEAREAILCMPEFAKGIEAVTKDQVAALIGMEKSIDLFRKQMFSNSPGGLQEYDDGKAAIDDEAFEEQARVGCDMDEARERVKNRNLYKNMRMVR